LLRATTGGLVAIDELLREDLEPPSLAIAARDSPILIDGKRPWGDRRSPTSRLTGGATINVLRRVTTISLSLSLSLVRLRVGE
jgi:hypothetical protein